MFIELTTVPDEKEIAVNFDLVESIQPVGRSSGCWIVMRSGREFQVCEPMTEILLHLAPEDE